MEGTPNASSSLYVRVKNRQILVHGEQYAKRPRMAQCRFAVPSTHTRIWFGNRSRVVCEPFGTLVYMRLKGIRLCDCGRLLQIFSASSPDLFSVFSRSFQRLLQIFSASSPDLLGLFSRSSRLY